MEAWTTDSVRRSPRCSGACALWLVAAGGAYLLSLESLGLPVLPREGGVARAMMLAVSRSPELFATLGALALASWITAPMAASRSPRARWMAETSGALLFVAALAATLATLPAAPAAQDRWPFSSEVFAFAQARAIFTASVAAITARASLLAAADLLASWRARGLRGVALAPCPSAALAWSAVLAQLYLVWSPSTWDSMERDQLLRGACSAALGAALLLGLAQITIGACIARREARRERAGRLC
jgi:hypothetical protein